MLDGITTRPFEATIGSTSAGVLRKSSSVRSGPPKRPLTTLSKPMTELTHCAWPTGGGWDRKGVQDGGQRRGRVADTEGHVSRAGCERVDGVAARVADAAGVGLDQTADLAARRHLSAELTGGKCRRGAVQIGHLA